MKEVGALIKDEIEKTKLSLFLEPKMNGGEFWAMNCPMAVEQIDRGINKGKNRKAETFPSSVLNIKGGSLYLPYKKKQNLSKNTSVKKDRVRVINGVYQKKQ